MNPEALKTYLQALEILQDPNYPSDLASSMINHGLDLSTALADKLRMLLILEPVAFHDLVLLARRPKTVIVQQSSIDIIAAWKLGSIQYSTTSILYTVKIAGPVKTFIRHSVSGRGLTLTIL